MASGCNLAVDYRLTVQRRLGSALTPWSGAGPATPSDSFAINTGCVSGFSPAFTAGSSDPEAGASAPFALSFSRSDTDQEFLGLTATFAAWAAR
jgi:hypothetical protein